MCVCGHADMLHWWSTSRYPTGREPGVTFSYCVDAGPCPCDLFRPEVDGPVRRGPRVGHDRAPDGDALVSAPGATSRSQDRDTPDTAVPGESSADDCVCPVVGVLLVSDRVWVCQECGARWTKGARL